MSSSLYHLVEPLSWAEHQDAAHYQPPSLAREGFIHFSLREQVEATAARFYASCERLLVVRVDSDRLLADLRFELADGQRFPHLYGTLNLDAVCAVAKMHRDQDGQHRLPPRF